MNAILAVAALLQVQVRDEAKDWRLITTANFRIYYPADEMLPRAKEFAGWFERARTELGEATGTVPPVVNVFLYRSFHDLLQSSFLGNIRPVQARIRDRGGPAEAPPRRDCAECRPNARSRALALAEPLRDRIFIHCQASDRWNYWFVKHELAHHCQFAAMFPMRLPSWQIALKNPLVGSWWWEGGADYWAGAFDSMKDLYVRDLAREGLYSLADLFEPDVLPPHDYMAIYYQGSHFWRFLEEAHGEGTGRRLFERTVKGLQLGPMRPLQAVTGLKRAQLEREFEAHEKTRWAGLLQGRSAPEGRLTDTRRYYRRRSTMGRWSPDGAKLAWIGNLDTVPDLYVDGKGLLGWNRSLAGELLVSPPSWSPDGSRLAVVEWITNRDRILLVDLGGGTEAIELDFDEVYDPAWAPDGKRIAFTALKHGTSDLYVLHLDTRQVERLSEDAAGDFHPAWSKDGTLAWIKETEGRTVLHVAGRGAVTKSWALMEYPTWAPDGKSVVLAADVAGVWDAFQVDPATGSAKRLTKVPGGAFYPQLHPTDGRLLITYYEGRGHDLYAVTPLAQEEPGFDEEGRKGWYEQFRKTRQETDPGTKTRVWGLDWLHLPVLSGSLLTPGAELLAGDRDAENRLGALGYYSSHDDWESIAVATNTRWRTTIGALGGAGRLEELLEYRAMPFVDYPITKTLIVEAGWTFREREQHFEKGPIDEDEYFDCGPTLAVLYANQRSYQGWDPTWGLSAGAWASFYRPGFGGDRNLNEYYAFAEASKDVVQDWIVWARVQWERLDTEDGILEPEVLEIKDAVRGAARLEGIERGSVSLELRFPIWRDLRAKPLWLVGLAEWWVIKDIRGFVFADAGYAAREIEDAKDDDFGAASAGAGLRIDFSFMLWPFINGRWPFRLELWGALVGQDELDPRAEWGGMLSFRY
jgi:hypothetical protein